MIKYPRTPHLEGSRLQPGDEDLDAAPFEHLRGLPLVIEEKVDGANCAISFGEDGEIRLQSRGHFLDGGPRERQFDLLKPWAHAHQQALREVLGRRYVMYGEWMYARHTVFYDALPHYFLEFDVLDRELDYFLSTEARQALLGGLPVVSVPVLGRGTFDRLPRVTSLIAASRYKSARWRERLREQCGKHGQSVERVEAETDRSDAMEGLYVKHEENGRVLARCKFVRASFHQAVANSGSHWMDRPLLPNMLAEGVDLFK